MSRRVVGRRHGFGCVAYADTLSHTSSNSRRTVSLFTLFTGYRSEYVNYSWYEFRVGKIYIVHPITAACIPRRYANSDYL